MTLKAFASLEFKKLGYKPIEECEDGPDKWIQQDVFQLLDVINEQGHSGASVHSVIRLFTKLAKLEPLSPLTGEDDEWIHICETLYQNKRAFNVFKEHGKIYVSDLIVFRDEGCTFTNCFSRVEITKFPYTIPERILIDVKSVNEPHDYEVEIEGKLVPLKDGIEYIKNKHFPVTI